MLPLGVGINMQTFNDLKGKVSLNNRHMYFIYGNIIEVTHLTCQTLNFSNKPCQVFGANTRELKTNTAAIEATINKDTQRSSSL